MTTAVAHRLARRHMPTPVATVGVIEFETENSVYVFSWIKGQPVGLLTCAEGTHVGLTVPAGVEQFRDLCWPESGRIRFDCEPGPLTVSPIIDVRRVNA